MSLKDNYNRTIDYMRISVTDRCNLHCIYCMPHDIKPVEFKNILTYEEIIRIVRISVRLGVKKIRLTGGEPLARKNIKYLVRRLKEIEGIEELSMTTNGQLLKKYAMQLKEAGLDRLNISIDSLDPAKYREITRGGSLERVLEGIELAYSLGISPIKINSVIIRGINDSEIEGFAEFTLKNQYQVRFIEFMPGKGNHWSKQDVVGIKEIKERIEKSFGKLQPVERKRSGPSEDFRIKGAKGLLGFIGAVTHGFCQSCNRLRLTADGMLRPCLFSKTMIDLKSPLRDGAPDEEIERLLLCAVNIKPQGHTIGRSPDRDSIELPMSKIGG